MALKRISAATKSNIYPAQPPEPLEVEIPGWLREKYPDIGNAFDRIVDYCDELQRYVVELKSSIDDTANRLRTTEDSE